MIRLISAGLNPLQPDGITETRRISGGTGIGPGRFLLASVLVFAWLVSGALISPAVACRAPLRCRASVTRQAWPERTPAEPRNCSCATAPTVMARLATAIPPCAPPCIPGLSTSRASKYPTPSSCRFSTTASPDRTCPPGTPLPKTTCALEAAYTAHLAHPDALSEQDQYAPPDALAEAGKRVYEAHCAALPRHKRQWRRPGRSQTPAEAAELCGHAAIVCRSAASHRERRRRHRDAVLAAPDAARNSGRYLLHPLVL